MDRLVVAENIMTDFARRTCITAKECTPVRYLWTDAFAVCNFIELYEKTNKIWYREAALRLVDQVHQVLGKHRSDDSRNGWISSLDEPEGKAHPTIGGLRIGKKRNERKIDAPHNERLEWEQDGQYFHYLTKWIHALDLVSKITRESRYSRWALELAQTAYEKFSYATPVDTRRMYWKMSIDLSYPLVASMGQHDALDGCIIYLEANTIASRYLAIPAQLHLDAQIIQLMQMTQSVNWESEDPLGIGGLLSDACWLMQHMIGTQTSHYFGILHQLLSASIKGLERYIHADTLCHTAQDRLAFRELGLSIGLHSVPKMKELSRKLTGSFNDRETLGVLLKQLETHTFLCHTIERFWLDEENQKSPTWTDHLDINAVMLATSLAPDGFLRS